MNPRFSRFFSFLPGTRALVRALRWATFCAAGLATTQTAKSYSLTGKSWPAGSQVVLQLGLGDSLAPLSDGNTSWNAAVAPALDMWNARMQRMQLKGVMNSTAPAASGDRVNSVAFSPTVFGQSFGKNTLAVAYYMMQGSTLIEMDVLFNKAMVFDSYRGPLRFPAGGGMAIADIRRVFLHEVGHGIGLNHPDGAGQNVEAVMNSVVSDLEVLATDDINGIQAIYGAPAPAPTPAPTAPPTATPSPGHDPGKLVNISTRMKVGVNDNVLIGGFIITGSEPKQLILRALGPSLTAAGIGGALQDPVLELYDGTGASVRVNDNWQESDQADEVSAAGMAPTSAHEAAMVVTLPPGSYTAVVRGQGRTEGIGLVEAYVLDSGSAQLVNLSTRGRVGVGEEALIGGVIVSGGSGRRVIIRALGPSLGSVAGRLADPTLEVRDGAGNLVGENNNWQTGQDVREITDSGVPPSNQLESAVVATLSPGSYTAVVRGVNNGTGVGLVEVFDITK